MSRVTSDVTCNICTCDFDIESEGGIQGYIGIIPFSLCPMCYSGLMDMYEQLCGDFEDGSDYGTSDDGDESD